MLHLNRCIVNNKYVVYLSEHIAIKISDVLIFSDWRGNIMFRLWFLGLIVATYIISRLILKYKFKIKKPRDIDVNSLYPKYYMYILLIVLALAVIISIAMKSVTFILIFLFVNRIIDSIYKINYLKDNKSKYYIIVELIFWICIVIFFVDSLFWR